MHNTHAHTHNRAKRHLRAGVLNVAAVQAACRAAHEAREQALRAAGVRNNALALARPKVTLPAHPELSFGPFFRTVFACAYFACYGCCRQSTQQSLW
jgi:hypothetical protein